MERLDCRHRARRPGSRHAFGIRRMGRVGEPCCRALADRFALVARLCGELQRDGDPCGPRRAGGRGIGLGSLGLPSSSASACVIGDDQGRSPARERRALLEPEIGTQAREPGYSFVRKNRPPLSGVCRCGVFRTRALSSRVCSAAEPGWRC
ncbi:hypothetical protein BQ8794_70129 [Mesorhizobium prunaredense]|uniref:Uncharacterized protein n=1 Tax=Mesorhizobium prunaredense TaxID=1631249 RepID=A0A1R3VJY7_9HYPH|nr:hypothetical protein BQ8794_70129 [Mesorhizobium prunaredense]